MSLARKATESTLLSIAAAFGDRVLGFLIFAVVVRFVEPRDVGLVALSAQFVELANAVATSGLGERVMQRRNLDPRITATLFWTHVLISIPVVLLMAGIGPVLGWFLEEPMLAPLMLLLSASLLLNIFVTVPAGLLARDLRYRPLTLLSLLSTLFGGVVAIGLAFSGFGIWALAAQRVAGVGFYAAGVTVITRYRPLLAFDRAEFRRGLAFALPLMGSQALGTLPGVVSMTAIGRNIGVQAVGELRIAQRLNELLVQLVITPVMKVFVPIFAKTSDNPERMRDMLRRVIDALALPVLPMFAIMAVVAQPLMRVAFGPGWDVSTQLVRILVLNAPLVVIGTVAWPALIGAGRTRAVFRLKLLDVSLAIAFVLIFSPFGVFIYAWSIAARAQIMLVPYLWLLGRLAGTTMVKPLAQLVVPGIAALCAAGVGLLVLVPNMPVLHPVVALLVLGGITGMVAVIVLCALAWSRLRELVMFIWRNVSPATGATA